MRLSSTKAAALDNSQLELILMPTEQCNFRCSYCYEDFALGRMSPEIVEGVKSLITARANSLRTLRISWFGGEPLIAYDIVRDIQCHAIVIARDHNIEFETHITTNGFRLNSKIHAELCSWGVNLFQVSLDGDRESHNDTRKLASGKGTFDQIWSNLVDIRDNSNGAGVCLLRIHLTNKNQDGVAAIIADISSQFGEDGRFKVYLREIQNFGGPKREDAKSMRPTDHNVVRELEALLPSNLVLRQELEGREYVCYAASTNSWIIRSDGRIGKCTVALHDPRNTIGFISPSGQLELDQAKWREWIKPLLEDDSEGMACPLTTFPHRQETSLSLRVL